MQKRLRVGLNLFKGPGFLCLIGRFFLFPGALSAEFINKGVMREKLGLAHTMPGIGGIALFAGLPYSREPWSGV